MTSSISVSMQLPMTSGTSRTASPDKASDGMSYREVMDKVSAENQSAAEQPEESAKPLEADGAAEKPDGVDEGLAEQTVYANAYLFLFQMQPETAPVELNDTGETPVLAADAVSVETVLAAGAENAQMTANPEIAGEAAVAELLGAQQEPAQTILAEGAPLAEQQPEITAGVQKTSPEAVQNPEKTAEEAVLEMQDKAEGSMTVKQTSKEKPSENTGREASADSSAWMTNTAQQTDYKDVHTVQTAEPKQEIFSAEPRTEEILEQLPEDLAKQLIQDQKEVTIQLEPEYLGKLIIKASFDAGKAVVSILCSNERTLALLSSHAGEIGSIMESNMGTRTDIVLDKAPNGHLDQQQQQEDSQAGEQAREEQRQRQQEGHSRQSQSRDFLAQLRLGLA